MAHDVWLLSSESQVYHCSRECPVLAVTHRIRPLLRGLLLESGTVQCTGGARPYFEGRRPCRRCYAVSDA